MPFVSWLEMNADEHDQYTSHTLLAIILKYVYNIVSFLKVVQQPLGIIWNTMHPDY